MVQTHLLKVVIKNHIPRGISTWYICPFTEVMRQNYKLILSLWSFL
nr:MAG TPA: hypothetical protein [Caudoviricetes sp.]